MHSGTPSGDAEIVSFELKFYCKIFENANFN